MNEKKRSKKDDSEDSIDFSKYEGQPEFQFRDDSQPNTDQYDKLPEFKINEPSQPDLSKYETMKPFEFSESSQPYFDKYKNVEKFKFTKRSEPDLTKYQRQPKFNFNNPYEKIKVPSLDTIEFSSTKSDDIAIESKKEEEEDTDELDKLIDEITNVIKDKKDSKEISGIFKEELDTGDSESGLDDSENGHELIHEEVQELGELKKPNNKINLKEEIKSAMTSHINNKTKRNIKTLEDHQKDIEPIVEAKGGRILKSEWRYIGNRKSKKPFFLIKCSKGHEWWAVKYSLIPSKNNPNGSWCSHSDCKVNIKTLEDHQKDIEPIVEAKGGRILKSEWRYIGKQKSPYFYVKCKKSHEWWSHKSSLLPSKRYPEGSWCSHPNCRGKSLEEHQKDIESVVNQKNGRILKSEWRYIGNRKTPYFLIECNKGHNWWVQKNNLLPNKVTLEGTWCSECSNKSIEEHQKDIESIVNQKDGKILDCEWRYSGKNAQKTPYFYIKCNSSHKWWVTKGSLLPSKNNPKGSWCKICQDRIASIGIFAHIILEYFSLKYFKLKRCNAIHENSLEEGGRPDLIIKRNSEFRFNIEIFQNILSLSKNIEFVLVDFTIALSPKVILEHCFRNYQAENRFLVIVLLREEDEATAQYFQNLINYEPKINRNYIKNIKIINFKEYLSLLNLEIYLNLIYSDGQIDILNFDKWISKPQTEKEIVKMFLKTIKLSSEAIKDDSALNKLIQLSEKYSKLL